MKSKIVHTVELDVKGLLELAKKVSDTCKQSYSTVNDEQDAIVSLLAPEIQELAADVFKKAEKLFKAKADEKDTEMYEEKL